MKVEGRCLCGGVSYSSEAEPVVTVLCHCDDCQRQSGSAFSTNVAVPRDSLEVEGESLATYVTQGGSEGAERERTFCSRCGSPIATYMADNPALAIVKAGTLDDRAWLEPGIELYGRSAQPWVSPAEGRRRFDEGLPG